MFILIILSFILWGYSLYLIKKVEKETIKPEPIPDSISNDLPF